MRDAALKETAARLFRESNAGVSVARRHATDESDPNENSSSGTISLTPFEGGRNNRVFEARMGDKKALLKAYFKHPDDPRDRCTTEFEFISFAWNQGIRCVPQPLAADFSEGIALYEFVEGTQLEASQVTTDCIEEAIQFFTRLNAIRHAPEAQNLRAASEACFSIASHLRHTERRVTRLASQTEMPTMEEAGKEFIKKRLVPTWTKVRSQVDNSCKQLGLAQDEEIAVERRRLSPSDFGFHNAIKRSQGNLCFVDFEYGGWDDIAKTVSDFFLHPAVPVSRSHFEKFSDAVLADFADKDLEANRISVLFPVHQVKWICIMLNDFLPVGDTRRQFSRGVDEGLQRKMDQLALAARAIEQVEVHTKEAVQCT